MPSCTYIRLTYSEGTHSSSTLRWSGPTHFCGIEPNSHGWITASRPAAGEKSGGHWWRTVTSAANGAGAPSVEPSRSIRSTANPGRVQLVADVGVDHRQAGRLALVARPADRHGQRPPGSPARAARRRSSAPARRRRRRTRAAPGCRPAAARAGPARRPGGRARAASAGGVAAVDQQAVDPVAHRLGDPAHPRGQHRHAAGQALGHHQRRAVPPQRGDHGDVDAGQQLRQPVVREGAADLDVAAPVERAQVLGERPGHLAVDPHGRRRRSPARRPRPARSGPCADRRSRRTRRSAARRPGPARGRGPAPPRSAAPAASPGGRRRSSPPGSRPTPASA